MNEVVLYTSCPAKAARLLDRTVGALKKNLKKFKKGVDKTNRTEYNIFLQPAEMRGAGMAQKSRRTLKIKQYVRSLTEP